MEKRNRLKKRILRIIVTVNSHHTGAYAAQAAYFFVLSLIPIFLLLLTMVQFTPVTMNDVLQAVLQVFPSTVTPLIPLDRDTGVYTVRRDHSGLDRRRALVSRERRSVGHIRAELYLCQHRDKKLYLSASEGVAVYGDLPSGDHAVACTFCIRKQYQCDAL